MIGEFDSKYFTKILKEKSITSKSIAEELEKRGCNISEESIKKYRQGKASPKNYYIKLMADILDISFFDLVESGYMLIGKRDWIKAKEN